MEPIEIVVAIAVPFLTKYAEKTGESLGEKTLKQVDKFWQLIQRKPVETLPTFKSAETEALPIDFERAIQELQTAANEDPEIKQAVIDVVNVAKQESSEYVKNIESEVEKIKFQGITAEKINTVLQAQTISGKFIGNSGESIGDTGVFENNTIHGGITI
ncbi:MAG: hypothetical protein QNJ68_06525 [Microcoleaceae cyanobacterium MO_207.B10]|nr:hypothetical protein [Microcoleaceae cyanobacterium MO_207.B10]